VIPPFSTYATWKTSPWRAMREGDRLRLEYTMREALTLTLDQAGEMLESGDFARVPGYGEGKWDEVQRILIAFVEEMCNG
jgi:O-succinylbenzoate synthase